MFPGGSATDLSGPVAVVRPSPFASGWTSQPGRFFDDVSLPEGFTYDVVVSYRDRRYARPITGTSPRIRMTGAGIGDPAWAHLDAPAGHHVPGHPAPGRGDLVRRRRLRRPDHLHVLLAAGNKTPGGNPSEPLPSVIAIRRS
jgi:hypothetical protein